MKRRHLVLLASLLVGISGCKTPQAALDEANNDAALVVSLEAELSEFRQVQSRIAEGRMDSIRAQRAMLARYEADAAFDERLLKAVGKKEVAQLHTTLKDLSDGRSKEEADVEARLEELDITLAQLLAPLPETSKGLKDTQQALATLGQQLSQREQIDMTLEFVREVRKSIDDNKQKIADIESKAPAPGVEPGPT